MSKKSIKIGNAGGFWGDDLKALRRQLEGGDLDYISADYLAEITMSILRKQNQRNPKLGYVTDFVDQIEDVAELLHIKKVKMITNAGGINPKACAVEIINILNKKNIPLKVAVIEGDNIIDKLEDFYSCEVDFKNIETGENFFDIKDKVESANVYLGVPPILKALELGADIIIAGRVTDTSITMAPAIHEFDWNINDWDKLASALVAGHIIECGAQSSGGNFTDWHLIKKWDNFGYPIVEIFDDGDFVVTKHEKTGGLITLNSIKEQIVYEMGDPSNYISPDVIADFRTIHLEEIGENKVKVSGVKGYPSTNSFKVSMAYKDGFWANGSIIISGPNAKEKAEIFKEMFWKRLDIKFEKQNTEYVGYNATHLGLSKEIIPNEILLRFGVYDNDSSKIDDFGKELAPLILSGPSGVAVTGGRPRPRSVMSYWPALIPKHFLSSIVSSFNAEGNIEQEVSIDSITGFEDENIQIPEIHSINADTNQFNKFTKVPLYKICLARSGDKGDMANIGVIARSEAIYKYLKTNLTNELIKTWFSDFCKGEVKRYELDNILGLNFLLAKSLDGGGTKSLMIDAQGKTFASALLNQEIDIPESLLTTIK
jgi:Acyclic terpene utilisation family protein AtuA